MPPAAHEPKYASAATPAAAATADKWETLKSKASEVVQVGQTEAAALESQLHLGQRQLAKGEAAVAEMSLVTSKHQQIDHDEQAGVQGMEDEVLATEALYEEALQVVQKAAQHDQWVAQGRGAVVKLCGDVHDTACGELRASITAIKRNLVAVSPFFGEGDDDNDADSAAVVKATARTARLDVLTALCHSAKAAEDNDACDAAAAMCTAELQLTEVAGAESL